MRDVKKEWTCLIYANGNNELAPETYELIETLIKCSVGESVNLVMQMSYECDSVIQLIRGKQYSRSVPKLCGRYSIKQNELYLEEAFDEINMADPKTLEEFITWGSYYFPAKKYMLLMGGHVYQFVGLAPDYSQQMPYLLSFCDMATAINRACKINNIEIELLILDTCYCSTIELVTEICHSENHVIKYLLTYFGNGPLEGMPYDKIIKIMTQVNQSTVTGVQQLIKMNHSKSAYQLIGIILDESLISLYKKLFNAIATIYYDWSEVNQQTLTPYEILACIEVNFPWRKFVEMIGRLSVKVLIKDGEEISKVLPLHVLYKCIPDDNRRILYSNFYFAKNNKWFNLLCNFEDLDSNKNEMFSYKPFLVSQPLLKMFIDSTNYNNDSATNEAIVQKLIEYKQWDYQKDDYR